MKSRKVKATEKSARFRQKKQSNDDYREPSPDIEGMCESSSDEASSADEKMPMEDSSEEEVLPISGDESENDDVAEDDIPNRDAWGRNKSVYFNADFVDEDRGKTYREEDAEMAKAEAEEALAIQRSVMSFVNASGFDRNLLLKDSVEPVEEDEEEKEDKSTTLTKQEKLRRLKKTSPEFFTYNKEFKEKMTEIADKLEPLFECVENSKIPAGNYSNFIKEKYHTMYQYCLNIACYMSLKSSGSLFPNHSVHHWINTFKNHLENLNEKYNVKNEDIDKIFDKLQRCEQITFMSHDLDNKKTLSHEKSNRGVHIDEEDHTSGEESVSEDVTAMGGKRTVTYEIAKNKGLTARRKKEYRNPRVHNRIKYRKAKIRRKGQIREAVKEIKRYEGEPTGISTHVVKSIKFK